MPATVVMLLAIPAAVVTFVLIAANPDIASVASVPSSMSASVPMSAVIAARL